MKKLYRSKSTVHPSPSISSLPAAILTLAAALSAADKEVLSYLLSCSSTTPFDFDPSKSHRRKNRPHPPSFTCYCFSCYTSYWARWDSSPNRQLIHQIIDAFEDHLLSSQKSKKKKQGTSRRDKRNNNNNNKGCLNFDGAGDVINGGDGRDRDHDHDHDHTRVNPELGRVDPVDDYETGEKQGSVRKFLSFIGERIWGTVWG